MSEQNRDSSPNAKDDKAKKTTAEPRELGGPKGPEPTRYGDWEKKGIACDF